MTRPICTTTIRLGTRGSTLARMQSLIVAQELEKYHSGLTVELVICHTTGDRVTDRSLADIGGKGLFTKEIEQALLRHEIDFAVHSFKDVPVTMPLVDVSLLTIAAVPERQDPRDVLISPSARTIADLPRNARIGTGSLRRRAQLLDIRPDLQIQPIRGNIDTRLRKLWPGEFDAIVLAAAGLRRSALFQSDQMTVIDPDEMLPAAGQGALALQCRREDRRIRTLLAVLNDLVTAQCVRSERAIIAALGGDCHSPIAAYANINNGELILRSAVGAKDGEPPVVRDEQRGDVADAEHLVDEAIQSLSARGAHAILHGEQEVAHVRPA